DGGPRGRRRPLPVPNVSRGGIPGNRSSSLDEGKVSAYSSQSGRRPRMRDTQTIKLTDLASCGGCAAKYSAARLEELLRGFVPVESENLLVGLAPADDAAGCKHDAARGMH